jgi:hypothetical protein
MFTNSKMLLGALALALTCTTATTISTTTTEAMAQTPQGFGQGQVLDNMKAASTSMKAFYKEHGNMPSSQADFDIVLQSLYSEELSGSRSQPTTNGAYRVLGEYRITLDPTVANIDPEMWRKKPPERFNGMPGNSVIILTDGIKTFAIWGAALSGNPILDSNNRALIIYKRMED